MSDIAETLVDAEDQRAVPRWPSPCAAMFESIAEHDPHRLTGIIRDTPMSVGLRARAATAAGGIRDPQIAVPLLLGLLEDPQPMVQEGALQGLAKHMTPEAIAEMRKYVERDGLHEAVRAFALDLLNEADGL